MNEPATIAGMLVACVIAALSVGAVVPPRPSAAAVLKAPVEPVSYCRAGWNIGTTAGPVVAFAPCAHTKGERDA